MSDTVAIRRQLKIKTGSVTRLLKEHQSYKKEVEQQTIKVDKLVADGVSAEEWDVKNAKKMLEESNKMIEDSSKRLGKAVGDLRDLVVAVRTDPQFAGAEELVNAESALEIANL